MTIRSALMRAFLALLLAAIVVVGALSFFEVRRALQSEIAGNLQFGASALMQRLDTFLASQIENVRVWRRLEVMQDIRVDDVDKRLSHFLSDLQRGQGTVYASLLCTDDKGRIVAASRPSLIGQSAPVVADWRAVPGHRLQQVFVESARDRVGDTLALRTNIPNAFGSGNVGRLYAMLDWTAVRELLDKAVAGEPRSVLLLDAGGRVIAASRNLRQRLDVNRLDLSRWTLPVTGGASYVRDGRALGLGDVLVGAATSSGFQQFRGLGWHLLMVEPTRVSFQPVWRLLWAMLAVLALTLVLGGWLASRLAGRIARPLVALTDFTRRFRQGEASVPEAPATSISEVGELHRAYLEMIQALERSREQIVRAGKLAVVGEMAAIMAHEVRTPMGIVRSSAQLLERQSDLGERERELIGFILSETERLNRLVTMLLECARPKAPDFLLHDLHALIEEVVQLLQPRAEHAGVELKADLGAGDSTLRCDREQMMQVLLNLVLNALSFVERGGSVVVSTHRAAGTLWVSVADDGPGVPEELRERIFDPFFSRREGGIGLGLTIVQQIVNAHGGEIGVTRSSRGGASFNMRFDNE